jgi:hypothetical protein
MLSKLSEFFAPPASEVHLLVPACCCGGRFAKTEDLYGLNEVSTCFSSVLSGGAFARIAGRCRSVAVPFRAIGGLLD